MNLKQKLYAVIVEQNPKVKLHYEAYVRANTSYHKKHRIRSWMYMRKLKQYFDNGECGELPKAPRPYPEVTAYPEGTASPEKRLPRQTIAAPDKPAAPVQNTKRKKMKLPYLNGSESMLLKRAKPHHFVKQFLGCDIVSFDIFDTLILRPIERPIDLFMMTGKKLGIMDFFNLRIEAEKAAREQRWAKYGNREVTIDDIYEIIEQRTGIDKTTGIQAEFETEYDLCYANPYMLRSYELLKEQGKQLILISDMYFERNLLEKILEKCGYTGYSDLFVSCEYNCGKADGKLYEVVKNKYQGKRIVHIGDNAASDIQKAREHGITPYYYKNVNEAGQAYRADGMSLLVGSAYKGMVNGKLYNGLGQYTPYFEYGYTYGGMYVLGYCSWIADFCRKREIDKVLFLARDGYIYQKVFKKLHTGIDHEYVYWSRIPAAMLSVHIDKKNFLDNFVYQKAGNKLVKTDIHTLFSGIGLEAFEKYLPEYRLSEYSILDDSNANIVAELISRHWEEVRIVMERTTEKTAEYLRSVIGGSRKIAIVDVGWTGKNIIYLKKIIHKYVSPDCQVECLLAAFRSAANQTVELDESIHTYLFSYDYNRDLYDSHANGGIFPMNSVFEIFTQAPMPSFGGIDGDKFKFDLPEVENYSRIREIDRGILEFAGEYISRFEKYPYMLRISGRDAFSPYRMHIRNLSFFRRFFSDFCISLNTLATSRDYKMETVGEILSNPRK